MSVKNSNDTIGNRSSDLPACSAVPWKVVKLNKSPSIFDLKSNTNNNNNNNNNNNSEQVGFVCRHVGFEPRPGPQLS
jgi:hypothetical protein